MKNPKIFLWAVVVLQMGAVCAYAQAGNYKLAIWWFLIATANAVATTF